MPHLNSYDSFKTKKSLDKKNKVKEKYNKSKNIDDFIISSSDDFGIVIEVRYNDAHVLYNDEIIIAKLRKDVNLVCNKIIFPGDRVIVKDGIIINLIKRTSLLSRTKKDSTRKDDMGSIKNIAANVDLAVIVVSAKEPPLHPKFIDRYYMILENSHIPMIICLNKCDLKTNEDNILSIYEKLGIPVVYTSTLNNIGINRLKSYLLNKQAIFVGNSGVGKSSLTNILMNDDNIKISHISGKSKRGRHTTTQSKYYIWNDNSSIIDTPGIRSLDVSSFEPIEIQLYFNELNECKYKCKYNNCLHYQEPYDSCEIKKMVLNGLINRDRYESYLRIMDDCLKCNNSNEIINNLK